jgi:hypothetical protein
VIVIEEGIVVMLATIPYEAIEKEVDCLRAGFLWERLSPPEADDHRG